MYCLYCDAGFWDVRVESVCVAWPVRDARAFWNRWALEAPPIREAMRRVPESARRRAGEAFAERLRADFGGAPARFPTDAVIGIGVR